MTAIIAWLVGIVGEPVSRVLIKLVGAWLSKNIKVLIAKIVLWWRVKKETAADHLKLRKALDDLINAKTPEEIDKATEELASHF